MENWARGEGDSYIQNSTDLENNDEEAQPLHKQLQQQQDYDFPMDQNSASALVISASDKAGMEGIDRARIDSIIMRESENSLYMQQQRRRDQKVNEKIQQMREKSKHHTQFAKGDGRRKLEMELETEIEAILSGRNTRSTCLCVDMDMFFMACELLSRPDLKDKPCCVGGNMISTSNYKARKYGVRSAMAGWIGDKLVEELSGGKEKLIHVPSNFQLYREKSQIVKQVLLEYDPNCRCMSLDEAFLDLAPYLALKLDKSWTHEQIQNHWAAHPQSEESGSGDVEGEQKTSKAISHFALQNFSPKICLDTASDVISTLRQQVYERTGGLTCSAGLGPNSCVAKIASDCNKPNGQKLIGPSVEDDVLPFLRPMPTRKVPGIGRVTQKILQAFSITTVQHLYDERALVRILFHPASAKSLLRAAMGGYGQSSNDASEADDDEKTKHSNVNRKGISHERTFRPGEPWQKLNCRLEDIAHMLARDMKIEGISARTITLKVKLHTFDILQRSRSMGKGIYLQDGDSLLHHAAEMLHELRREHKASQFSLRLMGIRCSNLVDDAEKAAITANQQVMENFLLKGPASPKETGEEVSDSTRPQKMAKTLEDTHKKGKFGTLFQLSKSVRGLAPLSSPSKSHVMPKEKLSTSGSQLVQIEAEMKVNCPIYNKEFKAMSQNTLQHAFNQHVNFDHQKAGHEEEEEEEAVNCPICNHLLKARTEEDLNQTLNNHIDSCLNASAVREAIKQETRRARTKFTSVSETVKDARKEGKKRLSHYFS